MTAFSPYLLVVLALVLAITAFLYASVGHGGASGYLALMALVSFPIAEMRPTALLLNIGVAGVSFFFFKKADYFRWRLFWPFALTSIPAAFLGGSIETDPVIYKQILGVFLIIAILRMLGVSAKGKLEPRPAHLALSLIIGALIGLFSGMIGIGGGIILSPVIVLLGWGNLKEAAAVSALFILANSISGMSGFLFSGGEVPDISWVILPIALLGGSLGAYYGSIRYKGVVLRYMLALVLLIASFKLFLV